MHRPSGKCRTLACARSARRSPKRTAGISIARTDRRRFQCKLGPIPLGSRARWRRVAMIALAFTLVARDAAGGWFCIYLRASIEPGARSADDRRPALDLGSDEWAERFWPRRRRARAVRPKACAHFGQLDDAPDFRRSADHISGGMPRVRTARPDRGDELRIALFAKVGT